jgi:hypothetical protein
MSLLAETLVEEWLNRSGYFTIRGARIGVNETDLLAVRRGPAGVEARHIEAQVSTNAIGYISPLTSEQARELGKKKTSVWTRPREVLEVSVAAWVEKKFLSPGKVDARSKSWPGLEWALELVHGVVRHPEELDLIRAQGIRTLSFHEVLSSLCNEVPFAHKAGVGTDIAEMIAYYVKSHPTPCAPDRVGRA